MNVPPNSSPADAKPEFVAEEEATYTTGFDWQRYKDDRRELHEKLRREAEEREPPDETGAPDAEE